MSATPAAVQLGTANTLLRGAEAVADAVRRVEASGRSLTVLFPDPSEPNPDPRWSRLRVSITEPGYQWEERRFVRWQEPAGECAYIKVAWISKEEVARSAGNPIEWQFNYKGWYGNRRTLAETLATARSHLSGVGKPPVSEMTHSEIKAELARIEERLGPEWEAWKEFITQPWVEYVNVAPNRQRQGLATALYQAAAGWLGTQGLTLRGSTLQRPEAEAVWSRLAEVWQLETSEVRSGETVRHPYLFDLRP